MFASKTYEGATTTGALATVAAPGGEPLAKHAISVKGTGSAATSWSVTLEGSLDGTNWTVIATHSATDGSTVWAVDKPVSFIRANVGSLTLAPATDIVVRVLSCP